MHTAFLSVVSICPIALGTLSDIIQDNRNRHAVLISDMSDVAMNCLSFRESGEYQWTYISF